VLEGVIKGVDIYGYLILQIEEKTHYFQNKEVVFL